MCALKCRIIRSIWFWSSTKMKSKDVWEGAIGSRIWGRSVPAYDYCRCRTRHLDPFLFAHCCPLEQSDLENHGE